MGKTLILIRHAKSSWDPYKRNNFIGDDHSRPLNNRGKLSAILMASYLKVKVGTVDKIFSSSATRATQTCTEIAMKLKSIHTAKITKQLYTFEAKILLNFLRNIDNNLSKVIIISHNPAIQEVCSYLISSSFFYNSLSPLSKKFSTCGVAQIELNCNKWNELEKDCGRLDIFVTPKSISD